MFIHYSDPKRDRKTEVYVTRRVTINSLNFRRQRSIVKPQTGREMAPPQRPTVGNKSDRERFDRPDKSRNHKYVSILS